MATVENVENLNKAIELTQKLRATVTKSFTDLADGYQTQEGNEKQTLNNLQKSLLTINNDFNALEKLSSGVNPAPSVTNSFHLSLDPGTDKTPIYSQLLHSYKWSNKVQEYATHSYALLSQNSLKRSAISGSMSSKKQRRPMSTNHITPISQVDGFVVKWDRLYQDMAITSSRPLGSITILQITIGRVMRVMLALRGLLVEWVRIKGYEEDFLGADEKIDVWSKSRYQVFQQIMDHATSAALSYNFPLFPELSMQHYLGWLHSYVTLFSAPCCKCKKHLQGSMPPTWRDIRSKDPYHVSCRQ